MINSSPGKIELTEAEVEDWFDAEDETIEQPTLSDEELATKYADTQIRIVRSTLDFTLHTLETSIKDKSYINMSPEYQRRARWDRKKKSLLVESLLMNVPIPPLFLFEKDYNQYEVMDGRQRLEAITEFLNNEFALAGLEFWPELKGKRFRDLPGTIQRGLLRRTVNAVVLLAETARSEDAFDIRLVLFRRLNTGGVKLNPQELRNALYPGEFNKQLRRLAREDNFTTLWRIPKALQNETESNTPPLLEKNILYRSMMDCELVLRFFAIRDASNNIVRGSARQILDKTMQRYSRKSEAEIAELATSFRTALMRVTSALGFDFHRLPASGQPSRPLYDAILVAASELPSLDLESDRDQIALRLIAVLSDPNLYEIAVGRGNTLEAIKERVDLAKTVLAGQ